MPTPARTAPATLLLNVAKIGLAGATITAVAAAILILSPSKEVVQVQESQADIALLDLAPESNTQRFAAALDKLGHEPLRVYNFNGNEVYFSSATSSKRPEELMRDYQDEFVRQGINERAYNAKDIPAAKLSKIDPDTADEAQGKIWRNQMDVHEAMLSGQIVPLYVSDKGFVLNGAILDGAKDRDALTRIYKESAESQQSRPFASILKGYRNIEAEWNEETRTTDVTAVWTDERYDARRLLAKEDGGTDEGRAGDPLVPVCLGCEQVTSIAGSGVEEGYHQQVMTSNHSVSHVADFYTRTLPSRGWSEEPYSAMSRKIDQHQGRNRQDMNLLSFTHPSGRRLTLQLHYDHDQQKTRVVAQTSP